MGREGGREGRGGGTRGRTLLIDALEARGVCFFFLVSLVRGATVCGLSPSGLRPPSRSSGGVWLRRGFGEVKRSARAQLGGESAL